MKIRFSPKKIITTAALFVLLCSILFNFDNLFQRLNYNAMALADSNTSEALDIPSDINFINDDKKSFITYMQEYDGSTLPLSIDNNTYVYYGIVNGYRLYRISVTSYSNEPICQEEVIGGYHFNSSSLFRPSPTGLYVIGDNGVYTLQEAYKFSLVDIGKVYKLYLSKQK